MDETYLQDQNKTGMKRTMLKANDEQIIGKPMIRLETKQDKENSEPMYLDLLVRNEKQCEGLKGQVYVEDESFVKSQDIGKSDMKKNMLRAKENELIGKPVISLDSKQDQENAIPLYLDLSVRNETQCAGLKGEVYGEDEATLTLQDPNKSDMKINMLRAKEYDLIRKPVSSLDSKQDQENETECVALKGEVYGEDEASETLQDQNIYAIITESQMGSGVTTDIQSENQYQVYGEDVITSQDMDMHICVTESQMEPCGATDIPIHGRRHTINQIPAVSENDQADKTTNQSNCQCSKRHFTLIALLSVTVCVAIATGTSGFLLKYTKHRGRS